jgi:hypothetical protein
MMPVVFGVSRRREGCWCPTSDAMGHKRALADVDRHRGPAVRATVSLAGVRGHAQGPLGEVGTVTSSASSVWSVVVPS